MPSILSEDHAQLNGRVRLVGGAGVTITKTQNDDSDCIDLDFAADIGDIGTPDASEVAFDPTGLDVITEDNVQDALAEVDVALDAVVTESAASVAELPAAEHFKQVTFTETAGAGTYTGTVTVPDGAIITNVAWRTTAAWDADTTVLDLGITGALTTWGNDLDVDGIGTDGILPNLTAGPVAVTTEDFVATIVTTGTGGTTGRTKVWVGYVVPVNQAAVKT